MKQNTLLLAAAALGIGYWLWKKKGAEGAPEVAAGATTPNQTQPLVAMAPLELGKFVNAVVPEGSLSLTSTGPWGVAY